MLELRRNIYPGTLIVFEGTDGAGKTTMIAKTKEYLCARFGPERIRLEKQPMVFPKARSIDENIMIGEASTICLQRQKILP